MAGLDDDSTESFNSNIIEIYSDRPDRNFMNGIYSEVENLCLAEFSAFCYKQYQTEDGKVNDNQPVVLSDDLSENQHVDNGYRLPKKTKLMTKKETMKCRKVRTDVRLHTPFRPFPVNTVYKFISGGAGAVKVILLKHFTKQL